MDAALALLTIAVMLTLAVVAFLLLTRMFQTIRDLRGVTTGLHDTMRWAVGQVAAADAAGRGPRDDTESARKPG
jgi:hypothetical protein